MPKEPQERMTFCRGEAPFCKSGPCKEKLEEVPYGLDKLRLPFEFQECSKFAVLLRADHWRLCILQSAHQRP